MCPSPQQGLFARPEQRQLLQPRLLQSIEVLQLPVHELEAWLAAAAEENQALVLEAPGPGSSGPLPSREATERHDEMLRNQPDRRRGLTDELLEQVDLWGLEIEVDRWVRFLIGCLDENGYLSPTDEELEGLAGEAGLAPDRTALGLGIAALQRLEPRGIGGRDMQEALLLQLDDEDADYSLLCRLIEEFLEPLAKNRLPQVARGLGLELEELGTLLERLRGLDPCPGAGLLAEGAPELRPDVVVEEEAPGRYTVSLEFSQLPAVQLDDELLQLARDAGSPREARAWARERVERARWVVEALEQRGATLLRVAGRVFHHQRAYLERGPGHLQPLTMVAVAEELGLHLSTVSRAVSGKVVQCPWGILPLRHFFQAATGDAEAPAREDLREIVRAVFDGEDTRAPLSDDQAVEELARRGHQVARRTVAKYRGELGIPSSYRRRKYA